MNAAIASEIPLFYPESDGEPMADTDQNRDEMISAIGTLLHHFREQTQVYVTGNTLFYYEEGNSHARFAPDVCVVRGVEQYQRRTYKIWEEGRGPTFVLEVASRQTWENDLGTKKALYAHLEVAEYFLYDAEGAYLDSPLMGYRLHGRKYRRIPQNPGGALTSEVLGLDLLLKDGLLHFVEPGTGRYLLRMPEVYQAYEQAEAARQSAETSRQSAETARQSAEAARQSAEARALAAEAEVTRLRALLEHKR